MPERSSKRKARRDSVSSSLGEPEAASQWTENVPSISDRDFSEISENIEKSVGRRIKDAETGQREILKMIENLSSKIDSLTGHPLRSENPIVDLYEPENQASTSRPTTLNELHPSQGQHNSCFKFILRVMFRIQIQTLFTLFSLCSYAFLMKKSTASCFESSINT